MPTFSDWKLVLVAVLLQFIYAIMYLIQKASLSQGMSSRVLIAYRHAVATIILGPAAYASHRKYRKRMRGGTRTICLLILSAFIGVTLNQSFYLLGLALGSSTLATAMANSVPAITFLIAASLGMEKVRIRSFRSMAKVLGTAICVGGALLMTLYKGDSLFLIKLLSTPSVILESAGEDWIKACIFVFISSCCLSVWYIMQVPLSQAFGDHFILSFWMCVCASILSGIVALFFEDPSAWVLQEPLQIMCCLYSGIMGSGVAYYLQVLCISKMGPLFSAMFSPLCAVMTTILAYFFLGEELYVGSLIGASAVIAGLYLVLWGKGGDLQLKENSLTNATVSDKSKGDTEQPLLDEHERAFSEE